VHNIKIINILRSTSNGFVEYPPEVVLFKVALLLSIVLGPLGNCCLDDKAVVGLGGIVVELTVVDTVVVGLLQLFRMGEF